MEEKRIEEGNPLGALINENDLISPVAINKLVRNGLSLTGEQAVAQAKLVVEELDKYFKKFSEEGTQLGPLTLDSSPDTIKAYQEIAARHGQIITLALSPLGEIDPLLSLFVTEFLRAGYKYWEMSPATDRRSKIVDASGVKTRHYQRIYHLSQPEEPKRPGYFGLLQRDAVSQKSSSPHAHWSVEAYTPGIGNMQLHIGADREPIDLRSVGTVVVPPGQVHAIANPKGSMTFTFLEIIGDSYAVIITPVNRGLLNSTGSFPKDVWLQQANTQKAKAQRSVK